MSWPDTFHIYDSTSRPLPGGILAPFAWDELMCREVGQGAQPAVHLWVHPHAFVMGLRDRRLPAASEAMRWLREQGRDVAVRNSGGAAVPLDEGVLNVSIVVPNAPRSVDFRLDFEPMVALVRESVKPWGVRVDAGEVDGAYCPGDYDLSVHGKKFCGIAQRRQAKAHVVQAFIVAAGRGAKRAELVRQFYDIAGGGAADANHPLVRAETTGSLQELGGVPSSTELIASMRHMLIRLGGTPAQKQPVSEEDLLRKAEELRVRYDK